MNHLAAIQGYFTAVQSSRKHHSKHGTGSYRVPFFICPWHSENTLLPLNSKLTQLWCILEPAGQQWNRSETKLQSQTDRAPSQFSIREIKPQQRGQLSVASPAVKKQSKPRRQLLPISKYLYTDSIFIIINSPNTHIQSLLQLLCSSLEVIRLVQLLLQLVQKGVLLLQVGEQLTPACPHLLQDTQYHHQLLQNAREENEEEKREMQD